MATKNRLLHRRLCRRCVVDGDVTQQSCEPKGLQRLTAPKASIEVQKQSRPLANQDDNWMRDMHPTLETPAAEDHHSRSNWIVAIGITATFLIGGLVAIAKLL